MGAGDSMANPQTENGYTRIANEILEALAITNLNGTQRRILDVVFRQTYGYQRKEHDLSLNFISKATNIHKMQIQRELTSLIERRIITIVAEATFNKSRVIAFNKNYNEWLDSEQLAKKLTVNENDNHTVSEKANRTVSGLANQIKKKENIKEMPIENFFENLWSLYPRKKGKSKVSKKQKAKLYKEVGYEKMKQAIAKYKEEAMDREEKFIMYGSTFFNSGYLDYLPVKANPEDIKPLGKIVVLTDEELQQKNQELSGKMAQSKKTQESKYKYVDI